MDAGVFHPKLDSLPGPQRRLWPELGATPRRFVLYGGTAIALRLGHRKSEHFDFFAAEPFSPTRLLNEVDYLAGAKVLRSERNTLTCLVDRDGLVQVSFFGGLKLHRVASPQPVAGADILVASLDDLGATKAQTVQSRAQAKDYVDIDALLGGGGIRLDRMLGAAAAVFGTSYNPLLTLKALTYYGDGDLDQLPEAIRTRLTRAAERVDPDRIPSCPARDGLVPPELARPVPAQHGSPADGANTAGSDPSEPPQ